jgi:hypothetical protein
MDACAGALKAEENPMARMPIEIIEIGNIPSPDVEKAISLANSIQGEFLYQRLSEGESKSFGVLAFRNATVRDLFDKMEEIRTEIGSYHPFLIALVDSRLKGSRYSNLFGSHRGAKGLAVLTVAGVESALIPKGLMASYFLYYFARYTLSFIVPGHRNHEDTRSCLFDRKVSKRDLLKSMRARSICDECREALLAESSSLSGPQLEAVDNLIDLSGKLLDNGQLPAMGEGPASLKEPDAKAELLKIKKKLDLKAQRISRRSLWLYLGVLAAIWIGLIVLTRIFGWDVMEPWTYFLGVGGTIGSYTYFAITQKDLSPRIIYQQISEINRRRVYKEFDLDLKEYDRLVSS